MSEKGPFTPVDLANVLLDLMVDAFSEFRLNSDNPDPDPGREFNSVSFYKMAPPPRARGDNNEEVGPELPIVVVRPKRSETDRSGKFVTVEFVIVSRRLEADGGLDVWAIADLIELTLVRSPKIADSARIDEDSPIETDVGAGDEFPNWAGLVTARFCIPKPLATEGIETWT